MSRGQHEARDIADDLVSSAETSVLGGILLDESSLRDASQLEPEDFLVSTHAQVFSVIRDLASRHEPIDEITVASGLRAIGSTVPVSELALLTERTPTAANVAHWAAIVLEASLQRQAHHIAKGIPNRKGGVVASVENATEKLLGLIGRADRGSLFLRDCWSNFWQEQHNRWAKKTGFISTGMTGLDHVLAGGLFNGELCVVGARPSVGKTALAIDIGQRVAEVGKKVLFFSIEMQQCDILRRLLALRSGVSLELLRNGSDLTDEQKVKVDKASAAIQKLPIAINSSKGLTALRMRAHARTFQVKHGLDLIIIDYLQIVAASDPRAVREQQVAEIARTLKIMAEECQVPVLALAQLNRVTDRTVGVPMLSDLRESGAIEQYADMIMFLWREKDANNHPCSDRVLTVAKNRNGRAGSEMDLRFMGAFGSFSFLGERRPT